MPPAEAAEDLIGTIRSLDADLVEDHVTTAPEEAAEIPADARDVVFFDEDNWRQVLTDLAYCDAPEAPVLPALARFASDAAADPALAGFSDAIAALTALTDRGAPAPADNLLAIDALLDTLAALLSLDTGQLPLAPDGGRPARGDTLVWSRIVQARLDRLGLLLHTGVGKPWGPEDEQALLRLLRMIARPRVLNADGQDITPAPPNDGIARDIPPFPWGDNDVAGFNRLQSLLSAPATPESDREIAVALRALIRLSGDADQMIDRMRDRDPGGYLVARSSAFPGNRDAFPDRLRVGADGYFVNAPLISFAGALGRHAGSRRPTGRLARPLFPDPDEAADHPSNRFALRLVQIKLWQRGHYDDAIDAVVGPNTIAAITEAVEIYGGESVGSVLPDVLRRLGDGRLAINLHGLDVLVFSADRVAEAAEGAADTVAEAASDIVRRRAPTDPLEAADRADAPDLREDVRTARRGFLGRLRNGTRRVFRTAGRIMRSVSVAVRRGLSNLRIAVDRMLSPIRHALVLAIDQIGKVRALLRLALWSWRTFIFGKPLVIGTEEAGFVAAKFSIDHDARVFLMNDPSEEVQEAFRKRFHQLHRALQVSLHAGAFVASVAVSLATWRGRIRLIFRLVALLRNRAGSLFQPMALLT